MRSLLKLVLLFAAATCAVPVLAANNILVFGDSLSAGYGIARSAAWPSLLQTELEKNHPQYAVVNASISGETTAGGLRRISRALQEHRPAVVILELGANDGLRGTSLADAEKNLVGIIAQSRKAGAAVLLLGMQLPPNYGTDYTRRFRAMYSGIARRQQVALAPFMLEGIAPEQFQPDNLHPNAEAQAVILRNVLPRLLPLLNAR